MPKIKEHSPSVFASRLVELRKARHLTQVEFAKEIGVSRSTVAYYEAAAKNPKLDSLYKIADFFDVPVTFLITKKANEVKPGPESRFSVLFERIQHLSPAKQRSIANMLEAFLDS